MKNEIFLSCDDNLLQKLREINLELPVSDKVLDKLKFISNECKINFTSFLSSKFKTRNNISIIF